VWLEKASSGRKSFQGIAAEPSVHPFLFLEIVASASPSAGEVRSAFSKYIGWMHYDLDVGRADSNALSYAAPKVANFDSGNLLAEQVDNESLSAGLMRGEALIFSLFDLLLRSPDQPTIIGYLVAFNFDVVIMMNHVRAHVIGRPSCHSAAVFKRDFFFHPWAGVRFA